MKKYEINVPRYTSYPAYPFWNGQTKRYPFLDKLNANEVVDLYIHIPFCYKLCSYCGCHRIIGEHDALKKSYCRALKSEFELLSKDFDFKIGSIHFGGGTPTSLAVEDFASLLGFFRPHMTDDFYGAIEIDPRTFDLAYIDVFKDYGINRFSLGIQDFNIEVQTKINRIQPVGLVEDIYKELRGIPDSHINFDLIYGLPGQSLETVSETLNIVNELSPDMLAIYSYAHLPERFANQRLIKTEDMPSSADKMMFFDYIKIFLLGKGYEPIGLDHFAKATSYLTRAKEKGKLTRNFMGHTDEKSSHLIGLGVSSISESPSGMRQNTKELDIYFEYIDGNRMAWIYGHDFQHDDQLRKNIISDILCLHYFPKAAMLDILPSTGVKAAIDDFISDGLLIEDGKYFRVTEKGHHFIRVIASTFDPYFRVQKDSQKFSSSV